MPNQTRHYHLGCGERLQANQHLQFRKTSRQVTDEIKLPEQKPKQRVKQGS